MAKSTEKDQVYTFFSPAPCPGCMSIQAKRSTRLRSCYADPFKVNTDIFDTSLNEVSGRTICIVKKGLQVAEQ